MRPIVSIGDRSANPGRLLRGMPRAPFGSVLALRGLDQSNNWRDEREGCNAHRYAVRMTVQLVTRVPDDVVEVIDDLVRAGVFASRSDAVRAGLGAIVDRRRRDAVGQAIVDGYRRVPPSDDDAPWSDSATAAMIAEEPW